METLIKIQNELKSPKNQFNAFGKYKYRSCEDILEALKPLLAKYKCVLTITDEIKEVLNLVYVESTAKITDGTNTFEAVAQAGINPNKKGMDISQSFGSSSSYSRKYALNGLFLIDDTKDADTKDNSKADYPNHKTPSEPIKIDRIKAKLEACTTIESLQTTFKSLTPSEQKAAASITTAIKQKLTLKTA